MPDGDWTTKVSALIVWMYCVRISERVFSEEICGTLGSLIKPREMVRDFVERDLHRDPPEFREWVCSEYWRYMDIRSNYEREEGLAGAIRRFLGEETGHA